jgi:hypothetical protein
MRYLFPFTTYVKKDGSFSPSYTYATEFVSEFRRVNQETLLLAWIGVPLKNDGGLGIEGWVDLSNADARQEIIDFIVYLLDQVGFDGIHLNVETVRNFDPHYLTFLREVSEITGTSRILSIAGNDWKPTLLNKAPIVGGYKWSAGYYQAVASQVDQIAVMTYDSFAPHPALYRLWLREQVRGLTKSLRGSNVELLLGLSVSRERTTTHRPNAENMKNGLAGICAGLSPSLKQRHPASGIAVYASWEATPQDWQLWEDWLGTSSL